MNPITTKTLYALIVVTVMSLFQSSEAQTNFPSDLIKQVDVAITTGESPSRLIEKLGDTGTPECEQALINLLSFTVRDPANQMPDTWRSMIEGEVHENAARQLIMLGSAEVVPSLRRWLDTGISSIDNGLHAKHMLMTIEGLGEFHDTESRAKIESFYQNPSRPDYYQRVCVRAITMIGAPESTNLLCQILENEDDISLDTQCMIAATLVRYDIDMGRQKLLTFYDQYLASLNAKGSIDQSPINHLSTLGDAQLISFLKERLAREPSGTTHNNISSVIEAMRIATLPMDEVVELAKDDRWENADKRYRAIHRLGREGAIDHIEVLSSLKPWIFVGPAPREVQQSELRRSVTISIREIRRRCWMNRVAQIYTKSNNKDMQTSNQKLQPTVETPVESGNEQGTAAEL